MTRADSSRTQKSGGRSKRRRRLFINLSIILLIVAFLSSIFIFAVGGVLPVKEGAERKLPSGSTDLTARIPGARALAFDPVGGTAYLATPAGLFTSGDGAATWQAVEGLLGANLLDVAVLPGQTGSTALAAGPDVGVIYSPDSGKTWYWALNGLPGSQKEPPRVLALAAAPSDQAVYALVEGEGIFVSQGEALPGYTGPGRWERQAGWPLSFEPGDLEVLPGSGGTLLAAGVDGLYLSNDGGSTWDTQRAGPEGRPVEKMLGPLAGGSLLALAGGQVYRSRDVGASWERLGAGQLPQSAAALALDSFHDGRLVLFMNDGSAYTSRDGGDSWTSLNE